MPDFEFHDWLDAQLRNVPLPADLLSRLSGSGPEASEADARLDAALRNVSVPADLEDRLRRIARPRYMPTPAWRRFALAASVFVAMGLGIAGYVAVITGEFGHPRAAIAAKPAIDAPVPHSTEPKLSPKSAPERTMANVARRNPPASVSETSVVTASDVPPIDEPQIATKRTSPKPADLAIPSFQQIAALGSSIRQAADARLREQATLGAGGVLDRMPDFEVLDTLIPRGGITPPRVKGYDLLFQLKHSEHPFVSPSAHPDLVATSVPLTLNTASYDLARRAVRNGRIPAGVRVEDFLAAQNYLLPSAPAGGLALHVAGCPSPLGAKDLHLVQLCVQSATRRARPHPATRLVIAVEMSWQMRAAARWEATEQALRKIADFMTDADRVTLVSIAEQPKVVAQDATARELQTLLTAGKLVPPSGSADFRAGFDAASRAARAPSGGRKSRVVFLTADGSGFTAIKPEVAKQAMTDMARSAIPWQIVCLADAKDSQLDDWAAGIGGTFARADSSASIQNRLAESLTGRPGTVAKEVSLKLSFNPRVVTGYRLLGHEAVTLTGATVDPITVDLAADQSVVGLYEVWIKPKGDDVAATAELSWRDPESGQSRRVVRPLRRAQLAGSFSQAPPWLQQGIVAAKAAEALRGSYYAKAANPLAGVLELADQVGPQVRQLSEFQELLTLVQQADKGR